MKIQDNIVIEVNDLISKFNNMDFDGDSMIALSIHSEQARRDFETLFVKNLIEFEHTNEMLIDYEHESIYSAYMLSLEAYKNFQELIKDEDNLKDLNELNNDIFESVNPGSYVKLYKLFKKGGVPFALFNGKPISFFELVEPKINIKS